jgi:pyridoxal phosphate enzyme (YggS family)
MPFPGLATRVSEVRDRIAAARDRGGHGQDVSIVAVTKTYGPDAVHAAWDAGVRVVGENRVQEAVTKMEQVSVPMEWHLIGHLQRNKVKHLSRFAMLQSLDSARLAEAVHELGLREGRRIRTLVEVNVAGEATKSGYSLAELPREAERLRGLAGLEVIGAMTVAPFDVDERALRDVFRGMRDVRRLLVDEGHAATELSMGMSNDFEIAVEEGATMVRLGTVLFGARAQ